MLKLVLKKLLRDEIIAVTTSEAGCSSDERFASASGSFYHNVLIVESQRPINKVHG